MRFLHRDIAPVEAHIRECGLRLWLVDIFGKVSISKNADFLAEYFEGTKGTAGYDLEYYIVAGPKPSPDVYTVTGAVMWAEKRGGADIFILAGYENGGVISVSQQILPFQQGANDASWWAIERTQMP